MSANATIKVNEKELPWEPGLSLLAARQRWKADADITVYNGFPVNDDRELQPGDQICFIRRGEIPPAEEMRRLIVARHTPFVYEKISVKTVGIAGLGGLGSALAIAMARLSVGALVIVDFDVVEPSNLNRQQYFVDQIGLPKVEAMRVNLAKINPYLTVIGHHEKITRDNARRLFSACDAIAECFDNPEAKSELVETVLRELKNPIVAVSGIAGYSDADKLVCRERFHNFYVVGDGVTAAQPGAGLMAPKVGIAAHIQANKILELLLDL